MLLRGSSEKKRYEEQNEGFENGRKWEVEMNDREGDYKAGSCDTNESYGRRHGCCWNEKRLEGGSGLVGFYMKSIWMIFRHLIDRSGEKVV